ncbi:MAG: peptidoglycan-binding protein [Chthoniobacterales bacterium]
MKHFSLIVLGVFAASSAAFAEDQVTATAKGAAVQHRAAVSQAQHQRAMNSPTVRQLTNTQHVPVSRSARYNNAGVPSRMYRSNGDHVYTGNSQYRGNWNGQRANAGVVNSGVAAETNAAVANTNGSRYTNRGGQWNGYAARGGGNWARTSNWDRSHHDRGWYRSHYSRFATFGGGYYYWDNGFWFPAYGYDPYFSTYSYDAPIYAYQDQDPGQVIANVQGALQQQGFYHGAVDGTYGPETRRALLNFQRQNGLPESGQIDQDTLGALGMQ